MKSLPVLATVGLAMLALLAARPSPSAAPLDPRAAAVRALARVIPILRDWKVSAYRNQDWCRNLAYSRGAFADTEFPETCNLFEGQARPFDDRALEDFRRLEDALRSEDVDVLYVNAYFDRSGLTSAAFHMADACARCTDLVYFYEPGYVLSDDVPFVERSIPLTNDWYLYEAY